MQEKQLYSYALLKTPAHHFASCAYSRQQRCLKLGRQVWSQRYHCFHCFFETFKIKSAPRKRLKCCFRWKKTFTNEILHYYKKNVALIKKATITSLTSRVISMQWKRTAVRAGWRLLANYIQRAGHRLKKGTRLCWFHSLMKNSRDHILWAQPSHRPRQWMGKDQSTPILAWKRRENRR